VPCVSKRKTVVVCIHQEKLSVNILIVLYLELPVVLVVVVGVAFLVYPPTQLY
jgi:hypothetical protein